MDSMTPAKRSPSKILATFLVVGLLLLVVALDMRRRSVEAQLSQLTMRLSQVDNSNTEQNKAEAQALIAKLKLIYSVPPGVEPTVATIVDIDALKKQNPFYAPAQNGDHLFVTAEQAILTNKDVTHIYNVVPVQIQQPEPAAAGATTSTKGKTPAKPAADEKPAAAANESASVKANQ